MGRGGHGPVLRGMPCSSRLEAGSLDIRNMRRLSVEPSSAQARSEALPFATNCLEAQLTAVVRFKVACRWSRQAKAVPCRVKSVLIGPHNRQHAPRHGGIGPMGRGVAAGQIEVIDLA